MHKFDHGGDLSSVKEKYSDARYPWIDLSTGINPRAYPWEKKIDLTALAGYAAKLPQSSDVKKCTSIWLKYLNVKDRNNWLLTAGSQAIINILPSIFPDHKGIILKPNYNEYERTWCRHLREYTTITRDKFDVNLLANNSVVMITNPNNPDAHLWQLEQIIHIANELAEKNGFLVLDEAYTDLCTDISLTTCSIPDNVLLLRSLGKFFGLAGLRIGLTKLPSKLYAKTADDMGPWTVSSISMAIAQMALSDTEWISNTLKSLKLNMEKLESILLEHDFKIIGNTDLYCLVQHEQSSMVVDKLNRSGIYVRTFSDNPSLIRFGLPKNDIEYKRLQEALT